MASRVQGATKCLRSPILITQSTASRIDASARGRRIFSVRVRNIRESIQLFELATDSSQTQDANGLEYEKALAAFEAECHSEAQGILAQLLISSPKDGPVMLLMLRVIQSQLGESFDSVGTIPRR